ncbi:MAG TPA: hypothetical protein VIM35_01710 [Gallionella sp.]
MSEVEAQVSGGARNIKWTVSGLLLLLVATVAMNLPRGFSDDLSRIGKGKAAVVLVRDKNAVESMDLMNLLDRIRGQYAGQVEFLLTDYDTPEGRAFMAANNAVRVTLVLFDAGGKEVKVLTAPQTAANLQQEITSITGAKI